MAQLPPHPVAVMAGEISLRTLACRMAALVAVLILWGAHASRAQEQQASKDKLPNIVFFLVDDLGWSDIGCYGSSFYDTPNVDRLARQGVRFTQAYAACHVCSPTRASLMTGKYPARLQLTDWIPGRGDHAFQRLLGPRNLQHLPLEENTIAEVFKSKGYRTAIIGKWHLGGGESAPSAHGFDVRVPNWDGCCPRGGYHAPFKMEGISFKDGDYLTDRLADEALKFIEDTTDQPFFLYLSHFAVHDPIQGREDLVEKYRRELLAEKRPVQSQFILEGNPDDENPLTRRQLDELIQEPSHQGHKVLPQRTVKIKQSQNNIQFAAMVEAMDQSLGRVMEKLEALDLGENTIVIFYSDNGGMSAGNWGNPKRIVPGNAIDSAYATSNLPLRGAKGWLYEGGVRVPLIVKWPGKGRRGALCHEPVISPDFFPTLLEMSGLPAMPEQHVDGVSFAAAVQGADFRRDAIYWHYPHYSNHGMQSPCGAVRLGDYKLIEYFENNTVQLFNLRNDPGEQNDLAVKQPEKAKELTEMLHAWREDVEAKMPTAK
jgi:arylsulfatase A